MMISGPMFCLLYNNFVKGWMWKCADEEEGACSMIQLLAKRHSVNLMSDKFINSFVFVYTSSLEQPMNNME